MSDTTNEAVALIRMYAKQQYDVAAVYRDLSEFGAADRATAIADAMEVAASFLRDSANPLHDAKAAAASILANAAWRHLMLRNEETLGVLKAALEAYDDIEDEEPW